MTSTHERPLPDEALVREEVLRMGPEGQLVGILSRQATKTAASPAQHSIGVVILNAGVLHRVGPHRLHVTLGRKLAMAGLPALRVDLGGIGDSVSTSDATSFRETAVADTRVAMTSLAEATGVDGFVIFGVCSGADNAVATALVDDRVRGIVLVDSFTYVTPQSRLRHMRERLAEHGARDVLRSGLSAAKRRLHSAVNRVRESDGPEPRSEGRERPPLETYRQQLTTIVDRGVRVFAIYSGIGGVQYNHADQVFEFVPGLRGRIDRAYFASANHTFTELAEQAELVRTVSGWLTKNFC